MMRTPDFQNSDPKQSYWTTRHNCMFGVGLVSVLLSIAGLISYAIVQVPSLRSTYGQYQIEDEFIKSVAYYSEVILIVIGTSLGCLVNILLVIGIRKNKRWYLVHWLIFHCFVVLLLFITAILIFVLQESLFKLIGIVPLVLIIFIIFLWSQVFKLFTDMEYMPEPEKFDFRKQPIPVPGPFLVSPDFGPGSITSDYEFYPADPITRGLDQRMHRLQLQHHNQLFEGRNIDYKLKNGHFFRFYDANKMESESQKSIDLSSESDESLNI